MAEQNKQNDKRPRNGDGQEGHLLPENENQQFKLGERLFGAFQDIQWVRTDTCQEDIAKRSFLPR